MGGLRIKFSVVSVPLAILQIEIASRRIIDYLTAFKILLRIIELSGEYNGFTIGAEEVLVPETDEKYPFAVGCYLKFETNKDAFQFLDSIDPNT